MPVLYNILGFIFHAKKKLRRRKERKAHRIALLNQETFLSLSFFLCELCENLSVLCVKNSICYAEPLEIHHLFLSVYLWQ